MLRCSASHFRAVVCEGDQPNYHERMLLSWANPITCGRTFTGNGRPYKGLFLTQPWDGQLLGPANLVYRVVVVGGDPKAGMIRLASRSLTMEDQPCRQTWTWSYGDDPAWELRDKSG